MQLHDIQICLLPKISRTENTGPRDSSGNPNRVQKFQRLNAYATFACNCFKSHVIPQHKNFYSTFFITKFCFPSTWIILAVLFQHLNAAFQMYAYYWAHYLIIRIWSKPVLSQTQKPRLIGTERIIGTSLICTGLTRIHVLLKDQTEYPVRNQCQQRRKALTTQQYVAANHRTHHPATLWRSAAASNRQQHPPQKIVRQTSKQTASVNSSRLRRYTSVCTRVNDVGMAAYVKTRVTIRAVPNIRLVLTSVRIVYRYSVKSTARPSTNSRVILQSQTAYATILYQRTMGKMLLFTWITLTAHY